MNQNQEKTGQSIQDKAAKSERERNYMYAVLSEQLFIILPLLVLSIVFLQKGRTFLSILSSPEWSFAAAILLGQTLVKFVSGTSKMGVKSWELVALVVAAIIVLGLVPSLVVLSLILNTERVQNAIVCAQIVLFILGIIAYSLFGWVGHYALWHDRK